eukprot:4712894-Pleurochrysis_carterae.AAC.3
MRTLSRATPAFGRVGRACTAARVRDRVIAPLPHALHRECARVFNRVPLCVWSLLPISTNAELTLSRARRLLRRSAQSLPLLALLSLCAARCSTFGPSSNRAADRETAAPARDCARCSTPMHPPECFFSLRNACDRSGCRSRRLAVDDAPDVKGAADAVASFIAGLVKVDINAKKRKVRRAPARDDRDFLGGGVDGASVASKCTGTRLRRRRACWRMRA